MRSLAAEKAESNTGDGPKERFPRTLKSIVERSWDLGGVVEKTSEKVDYTEESLKSRFI